MWLLRAALRRPFTVIVAVIGIALCSILALVRMPIDIFPNLNLPVVYVAQPYGGMSPAQMEGYLVYYYEYHFLYITGIESVESKSIQNIGLLKLTFHPGTDMSQALAQTVGYVDRARAFMPPGTVSPFIMRFDAGSVPVGYLVFSSATRSGGRNPGSCVESRPAAVCHVAWGFRSSAVRRLRANDCRQCRPGPSPCLSYGARRSNPGTQHRKHHRARRECTNWRSVAGGADEFRGHQY